MSTPSGDGGPNGGSIRESPPGTVWISCWTIATASSARKTIPMALELSYGSNRRHEALKLLKTGQLRMRGMRRCRAEVESRPARYFTLAFSFATRAALATAGGASCASRSIAYSRERRHLRIRNRFGRRHRPMCADRIDERAVLLQAVVEMRPGRGTSRVDTADQVALADVRRSSPRSTTDGDTSSRSRSHGEGGPYGPIRRSCRRPTTVPFATATTGEPAGAR